MLTIRCAARWAVIGSIGVSSNSPVLRGLRAGSTNLRGLGISAAAGWKDGGFYRDTWQARYSNFQLFSEPLQMHLTAIRRDHGYEATAQLPAEHGRITNRHDDLVNAGRHRIHAGGTYDSHLLVPVIG